jgi:hypothetical protein
MSQSLNSAVAVVGIAIGKNTATSIHGWQLSQRGSQTEREHRGSHLVAHSRPPWDSIIERQIERPMPMPSGFVV